jgi:outer membrane protein assembly factor BamB
MTAPTIGSDGTIYVNSVSSTLYAISSSGTLKWKYVFGSTGPLQGSPLIGSDGTIYQGSSDGYFYAIKGSDGALKWKTYISGRGRIYGSAAISKEGTLYVGTYAFDASVKPSGLQALSPLNGSVIWSYNTLEPVYETGPIVDFAGNIYFVTSGRYLYGITPSGRELFRTDLTGSKSPTTTVKSSPAMNPSTGTIYVGAGYRLVAVNPKGLKLWEYYTGYEINSTPAISSVNGTVYFGSDGLYAINPDGSLKWKYTTTTQLPCNPTIDANGNVFIASSSSSLLIINPDGKLIKNIKVTPTRTYASPTIGSDGLIYIGDDSGRLYAIGTPSAPCKCGSLDSSYTSTSMDVCIGCV